MARYESADAVLSTPNYDVGSHSHMVLGVKKLNRAATSLKVAIRML
jgi:hypothetical protein